MPQLSVQGCELYYEVLNLTAPWIREPETILLHHGLGSSCGAWAPWLPVLAGRFRIVRFDMRGHGRSGRPHPSPPLSIDQLADDLFALADAAGVERFHVVGESMGGTIALHAALRQRERIRTLTVSNGAHLGGRLENLDDWRQIIDRRGMAGWSAHMMGLRFFEGAISKEMYGWYEEQQASASPEFVLAAVALLIGTDLTSQLSSLTVPVLLLHGDSSPFIPASVMADFKARLPDARLQIFAHARHGLPFSHGRQCAETLTSFLDERGEDRRL